MTQPHSKNPLRLGIAGLGTVGIGVVKIIQTHADLLTQRCGRPITIAAVCAQSKSKPRDADLSDYAWEDDPNTLAKRDDIDVYIELIGGENGAAYDSIKTALTTGKHVITANKALLAHKGAELACIAESADKSLRFEAAVAGGIPVIKVLGESLAGNEIHRILGVMNGTCNYILTRMQKENLPYETVFEEARKLGYLEADPELDVGGIDAAHKLVLLATLAFGTKPDFNAVQLEGIKHLSITDIIYAEKMGYRIKLLGVAEYKNGELAQSMRPCLVPANSLIGQLDGGTNMILLNGDFVGPLTLCGAGAGQGPTASAVLGDVMDIARGINIPAFGIPAKDLTKAPPVCFETQQPYYLRLGLQDEVGAMAKLTAVLGEGDISIDQIHQYTDADDANKPAQVIIITHPSKPKAMQIVSDKIRAMSAVLDSPVILKIENL